VKRLHRVQRRCTDCGRPMRRIKASIYRADYDPRTGKRVWVWYWGCKEGFFGYHRSYLDGRPYHDAHTIKRNAVRARLEAP
jgi:hypothetical protein